MTEESRNLSSCQSKDNCDLSSFANQKNGKTSEKIPKTQPETVHPAACSTINVSGDCQNSLKAINFQQQVNSSSFIKAQFSTPKNVLSSDSSNTDRSVAVTNESEFSITNPFENQSTIDSLLQPSLSPSIFDSVTNNTVNQSVTQSPENFWNIDQIAIMNPVDIDLSKLHEQQNFVKLDPTMELKAQKAIDSFFATGVNISSPWSSADKPHYLAIISPAVPSSSRKKTVQYRDPVSTPTAVSANIPLIEKDETTATNQSVTIGTQTLLSIPCDVDLSKILGNYFLQNKPMVSKSLNEAQANEVLSNSSLRRKLFFHDVEETENLEDSCFEADPRQKERDVKQRSDDLDAYPMSGDSYNEKAKIFSGDSAKTPLLKSKCSIQKTPSSCQSPFSSSPVTGGRMFDLGTPCDSQRINEMKHECFSPGPDYSPIQYSRVNPTLKTVSTRKTPLKSHFFDRTNDRRANAVTAAQRNVELNSCNISCIKSNTTHS